MERKKAKLITLHHSGDARILKEIEGSNNRSFTGPQESHCPVVITQASTNILKEELLKIGLKIEDLVTIEKVANKFAQELIRIPNGKLALDDHFGLGLCEILS